MMSATAQVPLRMSTKDITEDGWHIVRPNEGISYSRAPCEGESTRVYTPHPAYPPLSPNLSPYHKSGFMSPPHQASAVLLKFPPDSAHRGPPMAHAASAAPSNVSAPSTPYQEDRPSGSRPASEFSPSHNGSSFAPRSPYEGYDVDLRSGHHVEIVGSATEFPFHHLPLFPEYCNHEQPGEAGVGYPPMYHDGQDAQGEFDHPPYPDPDGIALPPPTVDPYLLQGSHQIPYHQDDAMSIGPFGPGRLESDVGSLPFEPVDGLEDGLRNDLSLDSNAMSPAESEAYSPPSLDHVEPSDVSYKPTRGSKASNPRQAKLPCHRSTHACSHCEFTSETDTRLKKHLRKFHEQPYFCIFHAYGCNEVFGCKNEWVRHMRVQHFRLETWRCEIDQCGKRDAGEDEAASKAAKRTNDYGRKDLFLEHVRRIHKKLYSSRAEGEARKEFLNDLQAKARHTLRSPPPKTKCPCCPHISWDHFEHWLEHVAKGMEKDQALWASFRDTHLQDWMVSQELLEWQSRNKWRLEGACNKRGGRHSRSHKIKGTTSSITESGEEEDDARSNQKRVQPRRQRKQQTRSARRSSQHSATDEYSSRPMLIPLRTLPSP